MSTILQDPPSAPGDNRAQPGARATTNKPAESQGDSVATTTPARPLLRRRGVIVSLMVTVPTLIVLGAYFTAGSLKRESTDDAFVDGNIVTIAPRVAGQVQTLAVTDNQLVQAGQPLFEIDPRDFRAAVEQDEQTVADDVANAASFKAAYEQSLTHIQTVQEQLNAAKASTAKAQADAAEENDNLTRNAYLVKTKVISLQEYDDSSKSTAAAVANAEAKAAQENSMAANLAEAQKQAEAAKAKWDAATAAIGEAQAALDEAKLQLSYTQVVAPITGRVTERTVNAGDYLNIGQQALALVPTDIWITANYKETQLRHMRPGQPAEIHVDAYPGHALLGHVDSIQAGSGARFSLLPPENATGNYVKIVQRVPVKIVLENQQDNRHILGPGMSVEPDVLVNDSRTPDVVVGAAALLACAGVIFTGITLLRKASLPEKP